MKRFLSWFGEWISWCLLMALWFIDWFLFPFGWMINLMMDFNGRPPSKPLSWNGYNRFMDDLERWRNER